MNRLGVARNVDALFLGRNYNRDAWTGGAIRVGFCRTLGPWIGPQPYNLLRFSVDRFWAATVSLQADIFCAAVLWAYTSPWAKTPNGNNDTRNRMRNGKRGFVLCSLVFRLRERGKKKKKKERNDTESSYREDENRRPFLLVTKLTLKLCERKSR